MRITRFCAIELIETWVIYEECRTLSYIRFHERISTWNMRSRVSVLDNILMYKTTELFKYDLIHACQHVLSFV